MSSKISNGCKKQCDRYNKHASTYLLTKSDKSIYRVVPRAPVTSKNISSKDSKILAPDNPYLYKKTPLIKPKKTTHSEFCFTRKVLKNSLDYCAECGDIVGPVPIYSSVACRVNHNDQVPAKPPEKTILTSMPVELDTVKIIKENSRSGPNDVHGRIKITIGSRGNVPGLIKERGLRSKQPVQQYYKNENFKQKSDSAYEINNLPKKKISSLDTIKEVPEKITEETSSDDSIFQIFKDDSKEYIPVEAKDSVKNLNDFRNNNYFETHSVESRLESDVSATNLGDHKCSYRFYLNDRLFPVPLYADRHETIRCIECQLPLKVDKNSKAKSEDINGIIQTKVKIGSGEDVQDMLLLLPVKEPLVIKERRPAKPDVKDEVIYFGVIKLTRSGDSLFHRNGPSDSYALKYQKGYTEYNYDDLKYERVGEGDVVII